ncbi:PBP1b-binding outer membrane lipoprotein LpoB [Brevibacterium paucivorans]|uniref:PBP1b-binding outer membrane lipoprotein LpoB n=1 Tax=Brevibacterium paucivorans TaxID=170994 RepID=A0ABS2SGD9_9MICO|nr:hypothetical protein [Brevibacterium paucivorans]MBM7815319.1 PBP1b-binding outer membrane lipoprotein LpoB [Brevibacterium paucivorans]
MTAYVHRRLLALCAVGALVLTGCSHELPQTEAAPRPSEHEQSPAPTSEPIPKFEVPEYTTDLDLTAEEMLAAEEALIGLQRYIFVSEQVMKSGGEDTLHIDSVSVGEAKEGLEETANEFKSGDYEFTGNIVAKNFYLYELNTDNNQAPTSSISACLPGDSWGIENSSEESGSSGYTNEIEWIWELSLDGNVWKVSSQNLNYDHC